MEVDDPESFEEQASHWDPVGTFRHSIEHVPVWNCSSNAKQSVWGESKATILGPNKADGQI